MKRETMVQGRDHRIDQQRRFAGGASAAAIVLAGLLFAGGARADDAAPPAPAPAPARTQATPPAKPANDPVVAERGDVKITASQVRDMVRFADPEQRHQMETNPGALLQIVRDRLLKLALLDEAKAHQWDKREDVAYHAELAREDSIAGSWIAMQVAGDPSFPTDDQVQAAYDANKSKLMVPRQYHLAQIFLAVPQGAGKQTEDEDQRKLADLRQQVLKQHTDFAVLAKRYSDEKASGANGGELGWLREDQLVPQIRAAVQALAEGALSEPVRSPSGWHLIKLLGVKAPAPATLAEARDALVKAMRQERLVEGQRNYLANMLKQQPVQVNEIELSKFNPK